VAVVRERVAFWRVLAEDQERPVSLDLPHTELRVAVSARDLEAALDVLLENVFTHTAPGTAFAVSVVAHDGGGAVVQVSDAGAGLAHTDLRRGASRAGSTGLGLDIARRTADDSGGRLVVGRSDEGGAHIRLELGPPRFLLR
jgi:signal transduction histidine kinase